jgi:hypothetical protein
MFEVWSNEQSLFLSSHCVRIQQTNVWRHLLVASKQFNCFCKSPNFHTLFKILFVRLLLYLNVLFEPLACLQKSVLHRRAIVLSQEPWKSATKFSQYDAALLVIYNTLVIMYTTCFKNKILWILRAVFFYVMLDCQNEQRLISQDSQLLTAETWVQSQSCLCGICGGQSGTVAGSFLPVTIPQMLHYVISCPSVKRWAYLPYEYRGTHPT